MEPGTENAKHLALIRDTAKEISRELIAHQRQLTEASRKEVQKHLVPYTKLIRNHSCAKCCAKNRLALKVARPLSDPTISFTLELCLIFCDLGYNER